MAGVRKMTKTVEVLIMLVVLVLVDRASLASAVTCADVTSSIQPCMNALQNGMAGTINPACCGGLQQIVAIEAQLGVTSTCNCTKASLASVPGMVIHVDVSTNVLNLCQVSLGFSLASTIPC